MRKWIGVERHHGATDIGKVEEEDKTGRNGGAEGKLRKTNARTLAWRCSA
jgi:hypothetical protein